MIIRHNVSALSAQARHAEMKTSLQKSIEKLSSGYKINSAADDAAGLAISEKMRRQITGLKQAHENIENGINLVNTGEGAMGEIQKMVQRMHELCLQGSTGIYDEDDRMAIQFELDDLIDEIDAVAHSTHFNGIHMLLNGEDAFGNVDAGTPGSAAGETFELELALGESTPHSETVSVFGEDIGLDFKVDGGKIVVSGSHDGAKIGEAVEDPSNNFVFNNTYGGSNDDTIRSIIKTKDGGYFIVATSNSHDGDLADKDGNYTTIDTSCAEGGSGTGNVVPIKPVNPGTDSYENKVWALKLDAGGKIEWSRVIGKNESRNSACKGVELENGGFAIASTIGAFRNNNHGELQYTVLNANGDHVMHKTLDPIVNAYYYSGTYDLIPADDGFIVVGFQKITSSNTHTQGYLLHMDFDGNVLDKKLLGGETDSSDAAISIAKTAKGYVALMRSKNAAHAQGGTSHSGDEDIMLVELDNNFKQISSRMYGSNGKDVPRSIASTMDGGYIVLADVNGATGSLTSEHGGTDLGVMRFDRDGNLLWKEVYGGAGEEYGSKIIANDDGTFTILASTSSDNTGDVGESLGGTDGWMLKIDDTGTILQKKNIGGPGNDSLTALEDDGNGNVLIGGSVTDVGGDVGDDDAVIHGKNDVWVAAFKGFSDKTIELPLDDIVLEYDGNGNPSKWISFEQCTSVLTGDGSTVKSVKIQARILTGDDAAGGDNWHYDEGDIILQVGVEKGDTFTVKRCDMRAQRLFEIDIIVDPQEQAWESDLAVMDALEIISSERGKYGAYLNALQHISSNVTQMSEHAIEAELRIRDADMAREFAAMTKYSVLSQAAQAMLAQANMMPQGVLQLLK